MEALLPQWEAGHQSRESQRRREPGPVQLAVQCPGASHSSLRPQSRPLWGGKGLLWALSSAQSRSPWILSSTPNSQTGSTPFSPPLYPLHPAPSVEMGNGKMMRERGAMTGREGEWIVRNYWGGIKERFGGTIRGKRERMRGTEEGTREGIGGEENWPWEISRNLIE